MGSAVFIRRLVARAEQTLVIRLFSIVVALSEALSVGDVVLRVRRTKASKRRA